MHRPKEFLTAWQFRRSTNGMTTGALPPFGVAVQEKIVGKSAPCDMLWWWNCIPPVVFHRDPVSSPIEQLSRTDLPHDSIFAICAELSRFG
jgi:hypothetical protein